MCHNRAGDVMSHPMKGSQVPLMKVLQSMSQLWWNVDIYKRWQAGG